MAEGRRDYWTVLDYGKLPFSVYQTPIYQYGFKDIASSGEDALIDYDVPAGYRLHIINMMVSANISGINTVFVGMTGVGVRYSYFDVVLVFPQTDSGDIVIEAGGNLLMTCTNNALVTGRFWGSIQGYLESIT